MNEELSQVGWLVQTDQGPMFWPMPDHAEAIAFCEDFAMPVEIWAKVDELAKHQAAQDTEGASNE